MVQRIRFKCWFTFHTDDSMALKKTSALMNLGAELELVDGAGFTETERDLNLDPLSREVFVVTDFELDYGASMFFDAALGGSVNVSGQITVSSQTSTVNINNPDVVGRFQAATLQGGAANLGAGAYVELKNPDGPSSTGTSRDYLNIIATPNWFVGGSYSSTSGGGANKNIHARITGYRATCDVATYSALIAEQLN